MRKCSVRVCGLLYKPRIVLPLEEFFLFSTECLRFALPLWTSPHTEFGKAQREFPAAPPVTTDCPSCSGGSRWCSDNVCSSLGIEKQSN